MTPAIYEANTIVSASGPAKRPHCCYRLDGQLEVAGNGFLLPVMQNNDNENALQMSPPIAEEAADSAKPRIETQARQLIADRDFYDILEACKPRDAGHSLPSALAALLKMNRNSDESQKNELSNRLRNAAPPNEGDRIGLNRPVLKEWGSVDFDNVGARLLRSAKLKLSKRPESPQEGNVSDRDRSDLSDNDKLSPASSIASHLSTMLGRSFESTFLMTARGIEVTTQGTQLQKSPSIEFDPLLMDGPVTSDDSLSSGGEEGASDDPTGEKREIDNSLIEARLRKQMAVFDASYFEDSVEIPVASNTSRQRQGGFHLTQESSDTAVSPSKASLPSRHV